MARALMTAMSAFDQSGDVGAGSRHSRPTQSSPASKRLVVDASVVEPAGVGAAATLDTVSVKSLNILIIDVAEDSRRQDACDAEREDRQHSPKRHQRCPFVWYFVCARPTACQVKPKQRAVSGLRQCPVWQGPVNLTPTLVPRSACSRSRRALLALGHAAGRDGRSVHT